MEKIKFNLKFDEITLVLIVALIALIMSIVEKSNEPSLEHAEKLAEMISDNHDISFVNNGIIDNYKLKVVQNMNYEQLKAKLNAKKDFCIYIEDENGNKILDKGDSKLQEEGVC